jgi:hypothetical protein
MSLVTFFDLMCAIAVSFATAGPMRQWVGRQKILLSSSSRRMPEFADVGPHWLPALEPTRSVT